MDTLLVADNIVKQYQNHVALSEVSLKIPKGKILGLLGPNGAGKTSFIRIINQITAPDSGTIHFNSELLSPKHIAEIGYLPEERGLYKKMKVGEQALYLAQLKGLSASEARKKLNYWFKRLEIKDWWNKPLGELSKGMQQKIQFIITILHEPQLLILDEPFSGFDPLNANMIKNIIVELKEQGHTIMLSTHNMESVEELCDHIVLINNSKKILDGSVKRIRQAFKSNTFEVLFEGNMIAFTNALWTNYKLLEQSEEDGLKMAKIKFLNFTSTNELLKTLIPHVHVRGLKEILPSMKDIFIQQVNKL